MRRGLTRTLLAAWLAGAAFARAGEPLPPARPVPPATPAEPARLPIDLPTALRLADASNPTVAVARARVAEAYARLRQADLYWLPTITPGATYQRHDGQLQDTRGAILTVSRQSLFAGAGAIGRVNTADALFLPLIARRLTAAAAADARATVNNVQLDVASTYLDLLSVTAAMAINADTLARAEEMLRLARAADRAGVNKTAADVPRAQTEVSLRRQEAIDLEGRAAVVSARLAQLLLLDPGVDLAPADPVVVPVTLVPDRPLPELFATAAAYRPELAANRALAAAARDRLRQAQIGPFLPRLELSYVGGTFGGGRDHDFDNFGPRGDATASATWEFRNLGLGNIAIAREREAQVAAASAHIVEVQAQVTAEVAAAAKVSRYRLQTLTAAQEAVRQAVEMYRRLEASSFGMAGPTRQYDALEPLVAIQALNQARTQYLTEVIEYDRAQFRLYTALGQPPLCALPGATQPVEVPVNPAAPAAPPAAAAPPPTNPWTAPAPSR
ncbi:MAG TPA: TolC family protein [Gemmataceae bacterium]|jgi:outer membrane protein TolC